ncbi:MAG: TVP38/TMEM64 family protein [Vicinamibacterales bacterium]
MILAVAYVPAAILFVPGSLLTLGAGFLFGPVRGTVLVSLGSTAGAAAAFLVARRIAGPWVARRVAGRPTLAAVMHAVETDAFKIVLLTRLSPVFPFNVLNYAFGLTSVPLSTYIVASWIGMLPGTIMYVLLGSAASSLAALLSGAAPRSSAQFALLAIGVVAAAVVTVLVARSARRAIDQLAGDS